MSIGSMFGSMTGIGDQSQNNPFNTNSSAYSSMYQNALNGINGAGSSPGMQSMTDNIQGAAGQMAGNLNNNAAGQQANYLQQMGQNNANQQQSTVRSQGGTGGMANATLAAGKSAGSNAQAASQGLNSLYNTATNQLGTLSGIQNQEFGQNLNQANSAAGVDMGQEKLQLGVDQQNNSNNDEAQQNQNQNQSGLLNGITNGFGLFSRGGEVKNFHDYAKSKVKNYSAGGEADASADVALDGPGWANQKRFVPALNPGQRAVKPGNSRANDKVPAMLSEGEVILPRSVSKSPDAPIQAAHFMEDVRAKDGSSPNDFHSFMKKNLQHFDLGGTPDLSDAEQSQMSPNASAQGSAGSSGSMFAPGEDPGTLQGGEADPTKGFGDYAKAALAGLGQISQNAGETAQNATRTRTISRNGFAKGGNVRRSV